MIFDNEEFLHRKIYNKDIFVGCGATAYMLEEVDKLYEGLATFK